MNTVALTNRLRAFGDIDPDDTVVGFGTYVDGITIYTILDVDGDEYPLTRHEDYDHVLAQLGDYE